MKYTMKYTTDYLIQRRAGGKLIERLSGASLQACAMATGRSVAQLLSDNGYQR
jgi:hypothetical protein